MTAPFKNHCFKLYKQVHSVSFPVKYLEVRESLATTVHSTHSKKYSALAM